MTANPQTVKRAAELAHKHVESVQRGAEVIIPLDLCKALVDQFDTAVDEWRYNGESDEHVERHEKTAQRVLDLLET